MRKLTSLAIAAAMLFAVGAHAEDKAPNYQEHINVINAAAGEVQFYFQGQLFETVPVGNDFVATRKFYSLCKEEGCNFEAKVLPQGQPLVSVGHFVLDTQYTGRITSVQPSVGTSYSLDLNGDALVITRAQRN